MGTPQNERLANEFQTPNFVTSAKGDCLSVIPSLSQSSWPLESVRWIEAKDTHPSDSGRAVRWWVLASGSSWPLEPRRSLRGPISGATVSACQPPPFVRRPLGFWPSDYPAALGFPQSPHSHRASLPSGLTGCTDRCTLRDLTTGILRPLRRSADLCLDMSMANQRWSEHGRSRRDLRGCERTQFDWITAHLDTSENSGK